MIRVFVCSYKDTLRNEIVTFLNKNYINPHIDEGKSVSDVTNFAPNTFQLAFIDLDLYDGTQFSKGAGWDFFNKKRNDLINSHCYYVFLCRDKTRHNKYKGRFHLDRFSFFLSDLITNHTLFRDVDLFLRKNFTPGHVNLRVKESIVFVHGFAGGSNTFQHIRSQMAKDDLIKNRYEIHTFNYTTFSFKRLIDSIFSQGIDGISKALIGHLKIINRDAPVILVGHSLGCMVIVSYLIKHHLDKSDRKIQSVLMYAGAFGGSRWAFSFNLIKHLRQLKINSSTIISLRLDWNTYAIKKKYKPTCFYANLDGVVNNNDIINFFDVNEIINQEYDHSSIIAPSSLNDPRYLLFKQHI
jgi:hypothetical protein